MSPASRSKFNDGKFGKEPRKGSSETSNHVCGSGGVLAKHAYYLPPVDDENQEIVDVADSVRAVERLLDYSFTDKKLLEAALTHPSYTGSASYQRLEFVGDSALGLAITNYVFLAYPDVDPGKLSLIRAANISTEKLARVAIRHGLYKYVRHNAIALNEKVREFAIATQEEDDAGVHGGLIKAPKVLADIVESVAAAVYVDCNFSLKEMWIVMRDLLEPIITLDMLEQQPQPVTMLFELCQKHGKHVDIKHWRNGERNVASVFVDGHFIASASAEQKENAKLHAAKAALRKLPYKFSDMIGRDIFSQLNGDNEIEGAKQKLHEFCGKRKWSRPDYKVEKEVGRSHEKKYICSVQIEIEENVLVSRGFEKTRIRDAENSAASALLLGLRESSYI